MVGDQRIGITDLNSVEQRAGQARGGWNTEHLSRLKITWRNSRISRFNGLVGDARTLVERTCNGIVRVAFLHDVDKDDSGDVVRIGDVQGISGLQISGR